ncbi:MAG: DUF1844 domain-containing protein [Acidobacteriota bacterium]|nr:DUF1844 domain-containing protein [Acidobacteriota bacterium]
MPEQNKPFVVTDRRKFSLDGTPRPDAERDVAPDEPASAQSLPPAQGASPATTTAEAPAAATEAVAAQAEQDSDLPPPPTTHEMEQANAAYQQTSERLDTAVRAANPGMDHAPAMNFEQIVQSIFMSALMQLGATAPEGQQPRIELMGARQSIDMLGVLAEKTKGNLNPVETQLLDNALFELRMGFLEVTQALARSAGARTPGAPGPGGVSAAGRPSIVR